MKDQLQRHLVYSERISYHSNCECTLTKTNEEITPRQISESTIIRLNILTPNKESINDTGTFITSCLVK